MDNRTCAHCGDSYVPRSVNQKYCTRACARDYTLTKYALEKGKGLPPKVTWTPPDDFPDRHSRLTEAICLSPSFDEWFRWV